MKLYSLLNILVLSIATTTFGFQDNAKRQTSLSNIYEKYLIPENELIQMRDYSSEHYKISDTLVIAKLHSGREFYKTENGAFVRISNKIVRNYDRQNDGFVYRNEINDLFFYFDESGQNILISSKKDGDIARWKSPLTVNDGRISIENNEIKFFDKTDVVYAKWIIGNDGAKYEVYNNNQLVQDASRKSIETNLSKYSLKVENQNATTALLPGSESTSIYTTNLNTKLYFNLYRSKNDSLFVAELALTNLTNYASNSGRIYRSSSSATPTNTTGYLRVQNDNSSGCAYPSGYKGWTRYSLSGIAAGSSVTDVEQYVYVSAKNDGIIDKTTYTVDRVTSDPSSATATTLWSDIGNGPVYEALEDVGSVGSYDYSVIDEAANDMTNALTAGWFALGYQVICDEGDPTYYAEFQGYNQSNRPYLLITYVPAPSVQIWATNAPCVLPPCWSGQVWDLYWDGVYKASSATGVGFTTTTGAHTYYGKITIGSYVCTTKTYSWTVPAGGGNNHVWFNSVSIEVYVDGTRISNGYTVKVNNLSHGTVLDHTFIGDGMTNIPIAVTLTATGVTKTTTVSYSSFGISAQKYNFYTGPVVSLLSPANGAIGVSLSPTLSWSSVSTTKYHLQLSTSNLFTTNIVDDQNITTTSKSVGPLNPSSLYYWRVRSYGDGGWGQWTVRSFTTIVGCKITVSPKTYTFPTGLLLAPSNSQSISLTWENLTSAITVTAPSEFQVSNNNSTWSNSFSVSHGTGTGSTTVWFRCNPSSAGAKSGNISITNPCTPTEVIALSANVLSPVLTAAPTSIDLGTFAQGTPSATKSYLLTGSNLIADATVTAPTDFQVSVDNVNWSSTAVITKSGSSISKTIYVRCNASTAGAKSGNVSNNSTSAPTINVSVTANVQGTPKLLVTKTNIAFGDIIFTASSSETYSLSGTDLTANATVTAPSQFQVSLDGTNWQSSVLVVRTGSTINSTTIYVRCNPTSTGAKSGNVNNASNGASPINVALTANVLTPELTTNKNNLDFGTFDQSASSGPQTYILNGINLIADATVTSSANFNISSDNVNWSKNLQVPRTGNTISNKTIYVAWDKTSTGSLSGNIGNASTSAKTVDIQTSATVLKVQKYSNDIPTFFSLYQNYPNPFNPTTMFAFAIASLSDVYLEVYDVNGKQISRMVNSDLSPGYYQTEFNAAHLPSGTYIYRLTAIKRNDMQNPFVETKKFTLIK